MEYRDLFNINSELYSKARPQYPRELYEYLNSICSEHKLAWDCACGNGQVSKDLIKYFEKVYATDISENQIKNAPKIEGVEFLVQSSELTDFKDNSFDLICVAQALHWFDYDKFWPEVKRILKKEGIFAAFGYSWFSIEENIDLIIKEEVLEKINDYWAPQNKILWEHYRKISFPFIKLDTPNIEMVVEYDLNELFAYMQSWSATRLYIEKNGYDFYFKAYEKVKEIWGEQADKKKIKMDFCLLVGKKLWIEKILEYMHQNFGEKLSVNDLAKLANMSESHFIRIFKKETKVSPMDYLIKLRIDKAKKLLRNNTKLITEIAMECGFNSPSHFSTCFSRQMGITPKEYQNSFLKTAIYKDNIET